MRQTCHPQFHQTLFFDACNALGARLIVVVRLKNGIVSGRYIRKVSSSASARSLQNNPSTVGVVHIELDQLPLTTLTISWYRLMPINSIDPNDQIQSDDSPWTRAKNLAYFHLILVSIRDLIHSSFFMSLVVFIKSIFWFVFFNCFKNGPAYYYITSSIALAKL